MSFYTPVCGSITPNIGGSITAVSDTDCACQASAADRPIERGMAGAGLLAHVLTSKYCDHLPLYRQSHIYRRVGVDLHRSTPTLADWVGQTRPAHGD